MNKQQTINEMKKQIEELSRNLEVLEKSKDKVEFLRQGYEVTNSGGISYLPDSEFIVNITDRALTFATVAIARKVDKITQQSYKIAQYVFQKEPDYVPDWEYGTFDKYQIVYNNRREVYDYNNYNSAESKGVIYMSKHVAEQLVEDLNNGDYSID